LVLAPVKPRRRARWPWGLAAVLGLAAAAGVGVWLKQGPAVHYLTAVVDRGEVESTVVAAGIVQPVLYVDVGAQTSGVLRSLKVAKGDQVQRNQLLAVIDPVLAESALTAATATLANVTAQHALKKAVLVLAEVQRERNDRLFAQGLVAASDRDTTRASDEVARADVASVAAQIRQARAAVDTARANRGYTQITAPMAGEVVSISLLEGQTLNANQQAPNILRIADLSTMTVWAQVSEADISRVKVGQEVYFTVLGSAQRWTGAVRQVLPTPELINNVVFYDVLFDIPNDERTLKIQMTAQVFIVLARAKDVLRVSTAAIASAGEGSSLVVSVLRADGKVEQRQVTLGVKSEVSAEVKAGLNENEQVVIREVAPAAAAASKSALTARKGR
jgi:macrolide-specific efflux system membrane fusion protein